MNQTSLKFIKALNRTKRNDWSLPRFKMSCGWFLERDLFVFCQEKGQRAPTQALGLSLNNSVQIGSVHLIIGHGVMALNH